VPTSGSTLKMLPDAPTRRDLPFVVDGRRVEARHDVQEVQSGLATVRLPRFDAQLAAAVTTADPHVLADTPFQDIVAFLSCVGENWKDRDYPRRRLFVRQAQEIVGLSEKAAEVEANLIGVLFASYWRMHDVVELELGSRFVLDDWVRREEALVRAFPRGRSVHLLAGNVPLSGVVSILRALLTKNLCVVKVSSKDPVTPVSVALSFLDVNPDHPVARAVNVVGWPHDDPLGDALLAAADVVVAWGGADAVAKARAAASETTDVVTFGPKRSLAIVGHGYDPEVVATRLAHDVAAYDQRACFSIRQAFVVGDANPLMEALPAAMARYAELLPRGDLPFDSAARFRLAVLEHEVLGATTLGGTHDDWSVVRCHPDEVTDHPLHRMLFVHEVEQVEDAVAAVDGTVQTVAVHPDGLAGRWRDEIARRGGCRVVDLGLANVFRTGGTHDATYPLQRLVRMVAHELPASVHGKGMVVGLDQTRLLDTGRFGEGLLGFVP
jgi:long-chain-fatty-acyl-CoA reductase